MVHNRKPAIFMHNTLTAKDRILIQVDRMSVSFSIPSTKIFSLKKQFFNALSDVSLEIRQGCTLGIVGESGSGKTTLARTLVGLIKSSAGNIKIADNIIPTRDIQFVFQDPLAALNPRLNVEQLILEPLDYQQAKIDVQLSQQKLKKIMQQVGLDYSQRQRYAHEFSGGQCQRIGIARAMITNPKILICDEPVSALDVSVRAQVINLLKDLQSQYGLTLIFIAHDLSLVRYISDDIIVLYQGRVVEQGDTARVFSHPGHPYTKALIEAEPRPDPEFERQREYAPRQSHKELKIPELACAYAGRCHNRQSKCMQAQPEWVTLSNTHNVACFYPLK